MTPSGYAIWLYGSHARGVTDYASDLDVLVISNSSIRLNDLQRRASLSLDNAAVSRYTWTETETMAGYGSLFLQHIRLEGTPLYESPEHVGSLARILNGMGQYAFEDRDIRGFQRVLDDVAESLGSNTREVFEYAVLGTLIRHSSILGCWLLGTPEFGRYEAVTKFVRLRNLRPDIAHDFPELYHYRLYSEHRVKRPGGCAVSLVEWLGRAHQLVDSLSELAHE